MKKVSIKESDLKKIIHESLGKQLIESSVPKNVLDFVQQNPKIVTIDLLNTCYDQIVIKNSTVKA